MPEICDVESLLIDKGIYYKPAGKDVKITCLNPEHEDETPSLRIDREHGKFHCLSCGYKGNIFTYFNRHRNIFSARVSDIQKNITEIRKASWAGYEYPVGCHFVNHEFRGLTSKVMGDFKAFTTDKIGMEDRIVFPIINTRGCIVGFQGRYEHSEAVPKYLMYPKEVKLPWYPNPSQLDLEYGTIILVEGLVDALSLHSNDIECAVSTFGTKSSKIDNIFELLTPFMLAGVQRVIIAMDGDPAGRQATEHLQEIIKIKTDLVVETFDLPDGVDPGSMNAYQLTCLKNQLLNK